jgi:hypothetical protein
VSVCLAMEAGVSIRTMASLNKPPACRRDGSSRRHPPSMPTGHVAHRAACTLRLLVHSQRWQEAH